jgi:magnesium chelatase family protein
MVEHTRLLQENAQNSDSHIRARVLQACKVQKERYGDVMTNSAMTNQTIRLLGCVTSEAESLLNHASQKLNLSARSYMRTIKVARTIADLNGDTKIKPNHISEALHYRNHGASVVE